MIAEVIVDITHSNVDKIFDYGIPLSLNVRRGDRVTIPFGHQQIEGFVMNIKENSQLPKEKIKDIIKVLDDIPPLIDDTLDLTAFVAKKYHALTCEVLRLMIPSQMRGGKVKEVFKNYVKCSDIDFGDAVKLIKANAKNQLSALEAIYAGEKDYSMLGESFGYQALKALVDKGLITVYQEQRGRVPYEFMECKSLRFKLTENQQKAIDIIEKTDKQITLINGVTGCGKTEIYLTLFEKAMQSGKTAIMLVPEIALTPQMVGILRSRFGDYVAIIHSGLSIGERFDEWWRIRKGEARIVVGARSAIFAPLQNIDVIVIDEEHEQSYISESSPRYDTLEVAKHRANTSGAKIVLGSATPSIESYYKAKNGTYELVEISERVNKMIMPHFDIIDMKREVTGGNKSVISSFLKDKLSDCLESGNQAILFLNRRGFASYYQCEDCGYVCKCNDCDVSLTYHKDEHALKCHYCGQKYVIPTQCPECHGTHFKRGGVGTETVIKELLELFPKVRALRMDNDTTTTKEAHNNILQEFRDKKADVLVGTQMVAKGHDFPSVTLVGIINADMSLYFSDFRSSERTFQLITQVAGRAGRGDKAGTVVLQTFSPRHYIYNFATHYNYKEFYEYEVNARQVTNFPPFADIVRVMMYSDVESKVRDVARILYNKMKDFKEKESDSFSYFNGMKSPIKRIENKFRYQIVARLVGDKREEIIEKLYDIIDENKQNGVVSFLEVNPNSMF